MRARKVQLIANREHVATREPVVFASQEQGISERPIQVRVAEIAEPKIKLPPIRRPIEGVLRVVVDAVPTVKPVVRTPHRLPDCKVRRDATIDAMGAKSEMVGEFAILYLADKKPLTLWRLFRVGHRR